MGEVVVWMISDSSDEEGKAICMKARKLSADEISTFANLCRLVAQREDFCKDNWIGLAKDHKRSVFYQLNLQHAAKVFVAQDIELLAPLTEDDQMIKRIGDAMFCLRTLSLLGEAEASIREEARAFSLTREGLIASEQHRLCLSKGSNVINLSVSLNG